MSSILQSEQYVDACIDLWEEKLGEMADRKESFDLWLWTRMYSNPSTRALTGPILVWYESDSDRLANTAPGPGTRTT
jgi:hypothetical protein